MADKKRRPFQFKQFSIADDHCAMKVGTDGVLIGAWADTTQHQNILDIGTGSGLMAIMTAQKNKTTKIIGIEIDESAAKQASENVYNSPWANRIKIIHSPLSDFIQTHTKKMDHIITNPPFFVTPAAAKNQKRNQARNTESLTQDELIYSVNLLLTQEGSFSLILPVNEGEIFIKKMKENNFFLQRICHVRPKKEKKTERLLMEFSKREPYQIIEEELIIQHEKRNDWTEDYIQLTKEFYLGM